MLSDEDRPVVTHQPEGEVRGGLVLIHGLGDHARRHAATAASFAEAGIAVAIPELPGHGQAPGRRGHVPGVGAVDTTIADGLALLRELAPGVTYGIAGHSMGALLVADHFARGAGEDDFEWIWLSSALVNPGHGKPKWLQLAGRALSKVWPSLTITNGVQPGDGFDGGADPETVERERASGTHRRLSVGLGAELLRMGPRVMAVAPELFGDRPVLMTHGDEDRVCPLRFAEPLFEALPSPDKRLLVIEGARHEPWHDPKVALQIRDWLCATCGSLARP